MKKEKWYELKFKEFSSKNHQVSRFDLYKTLPPALEMLGLKTLFDTYFDKDPNNTEISKELDKFYTHLFNSIKGNTKLANVIIQKKTDSYEEKILDLYKYIFRSFKIMAELDPFSIDLEFRKNYLTYSNKSIIFHIKMRVQELINDLSKLNESDFFFFAGKMQEDFNALTKTLKNIIKNYIEIDKKDSVVANITISTNNKDIEVFIDKIYPKLNKYFMNTKFFDSDRIKHLKKSINDWKEYAKTTEEKNIKKDNEELEKLVRNGIENYFNQECKNDEYKNLTLKLFDENKTIKTILITGYSELPDLDWYDSETWVKRYNKAIEGIENLTIHFKI